MKGILIGAAALGALLASSAQAQTLVYWPAPASSAQASQMTYFPMGTPLTLTTRTQLSTKDNKPGDRFYLEVAEDLSYQGQVVVPAGSVAVGEVARVQRNGHFGKKGKLGVRLLYVETPNGPVRISGQAGDEGTSGTATSIATIAFVSPLGFLIHGTSAQLPADTVVQAYLAQDLRFRAQPGMTQVATTQALPDGAEMMARADNGQPLPARFDPGAFRGGKQSAQR